VLKIGPKVMNDVPPRDRDIAMVFQSYALYPHMKVRDNLAFGLRMRGTAPSEIKTRVDEAAEMLGIGALLDRYPRELSGGQRQRVAMGRAVVRRPKVFLFDEPLSNLDAALRHQMRVELLRLHRSLATTIIYVTHDQVEAMTLASRIAVLKQGELLQVGPPAELYGSPGNTFVARFFGTPEMNLIEGAIAGGQFRAGSGMSAVHLAAPGYDDGPATLGVRAEDLRMTLISSADADTGAPRAVVDVVEHLGFEDLVHLRLGERGLIARCPTEQAIAVGATVRLELVAARCRLFDPKGAQLLPRASAPGLVA